MNEEQKKDVQGMIDTTLRKSFPLKKLGDTPTDAQQLTPKRYVDNGISSVLSSVSGSISSVVSSLVSAINIVASSFGASSKLSQAFSAGETFVQALPVALGPYQTNAITLDDKASARVNATGGGAPHTYDITFSVGNNSNRLLLCFVSAAEVISGSYAGSGMTELLNTSVGGQALTILYITSPTTGSNTLNLTGFQSNEQFGYAIYSYYNVSTSSPFQQNPSTSAGSAASVSQSVTPQTLASLLLSAVLATTATSGHTYTLTGMSGNQIAAFDTATGFPFMSGDNFITSNLSSKTISSAISPGTADFVLITLELNPSASASFRAFKASAAAATTYGYDVAWKSNAFIGYAENAANVGSIVSVTIAGTATGFASLATGTQYYLSNTSGSVATTAGTNTRKVGIALSTTEMLDTNIW